MITVIKRDGTQEKYDNNKIITAIKKSASRVGYELTNKELADVCKNVNEAIFPNEVIYVDIIHNFVEQSLDAIAPPVAKSYKDYRNYKKEFGVYLMNDIEAQVKRTLEEVDRENSNSNTRYISTKRTEVAQLFSKEMFQKMYISKDMLSAIKDGYLYIHDLKDMLLPQFNCCLADYKTILDGGFELEGIKYTEPKDIRTAIGQMGDIVQIISAQHFGK